MKKPLPLVLCVLMLVTACGKESKENKDPTATPQQISNDQLITEETQRVIDAVNSDNYERLDQLLTNGTKVNLDVILANGHTLLTESLKESRNNIANRLVLAGADINKKNDEGTTPLMMAASRGNIDFMKNTLLRLKAEIDSQDNKGDTAVHYAILGKQEVAADLLIENAAELRILNLDKKDSEALAREMGMTALLAKIIRIVDNQRGRPDQATVLAAVKSGNFTLVDEMLKVDPAIVTEYAHLNLLFQAVSTLNGNIASRMVETLLENKLHPDGLLGSSDVPLIEAVKQGKDALVTLLIKSKASVEKKDANAETAMIAAVKKNNADMVKALDDAGADKKYKETIDGEKEKFNACKIARAIGKDLKDSAEKDKNKLIKKTLVCGARFLIPSFLR